MQDGLKSNTTNPVTRSAHRVMGFFLGKIMKKYAVACNMEKYEKDMYRHATTLHIYEAENDFEAKGMASEESLSENKGYSIYSVLALEIK